MKYILRVGGGSYPEERHCLLHEALIQLYHGIYVAFRSWLLHSSLDDFFLMENSADQWRSVAIFIKFSLLKFSVKVVIDSLMNIW